MHWKFWQREPKYVIENTITEIPLPVLARWYFYDAGLEEPNKIASLVGMMPVSDEGEEQEESESDARLLSVMPLVPFLETIADINARAITALQFDHYTKEQGMNEEQLEHEKVHIEDMYVQVGYSALLSAFASGLELGIISTNTVKGDIHI
jgi:hypothetical protein